MGTAKTDMSLKSGVEENRRRGEERLGPRFTSRYLEWRGNGLVGCVFLRAQRFEDVETISSYDLAVRALELKTAVSVFSGIFLLNVVTVSRSVASKGESYGGALPAKRPRG
ncbi:hypothetical protein J6590_067895 [Homalodisca vitripennis]|nr:hypothetical protein J6590_067895 [Homalodisca vitripennis]